MHGSLTSTQAILPNNPVKRLNCCSTVILCSLLASRLDPYITGVLLGYTITQAVQLHKILEKYLNPRQFLTAWQFYKLL